MAFRTETLLFALLALASCTATPGAGRDSGTGDQGTTDILPIATDLRPADLASDATTRTIGHGCVSREQCGDDAPLCLLLDRRSYRGLCSRTCTADDPTTPVLNEDDCPTDFICAAFESAGTVSRYCLQRCEPSLKANPCDPSSQTTCDPRSTQLGDNVQPVCWRLACTSGRDCPVLEAATCGGDADCSTVAADAFCEPSTGRCARPGNCTPGGICGPHQLGKQDAEVGAPCYSDRDCPNNGYCLLEGKLGPRAPYNRGGYCTVPNCAFASVLPEFACPRGSTCHRLFYGGLCHSVCDPSNAASCRNHDGDRGGDYECYAWNNLLLRSGDPVSSQPLCQPATSVGCMDLGGKLSCSDLGGPMNPTRMRCRDRYSGLDTDQTNANGVCLDDTASGPFGG
ncbi:MAG: hypothetical protein H6707_14385 [Deltaproteobacteria bacterium]|nr:hypothetical protein [Deltaproteobacteria bacterium]